MKNTNVSFIRISGDWLTVADAYQTVRNRSNEIDTGPGWRRMMLMEEHPSVNMIIFNFRWDWVPSWIILHNVRNFQNIHWFYWCAPNHERWLRFPSVPLEGQCTALDLIRASRLALCKNTPKEVRDYWYMLKKEIARYQPEIADAMVQECVFRGFCPKINTCAFSQSTTFRRHREKYCKDYRLRKDGKVTDPVTGTKYCKYSLEEMDEQNKRIYKKHLSKVSQHETGKDPED